MPLEVWKWSEEIETTATAADFHAGNPTNII